MLGQDAQEIRLLSCKLVSPVTSLEKAISFFSYVPFTIDVHAKLKHIPKNKLDSLRIVVILENGIEKLFPISQECICDYKEKDNSCTVRAKVNLHLAEAWTGMFLMNRSVVLITLW